MILFLVVPFHLQSPNFGVVVVPPVGYVCVKVPFLIGLDDVWSSCMSCVLGLVSLSAVPSFLSKMYDDGVSISWLEVYGLY